MGQMAKKVTMQQIAEQAGVSKYAVSKALSGQSGVSDETRERIVKIATQLGYFLQENRGNHWKSGVAKEKGKANTIVVLLPNVRMQNRASSFWGRIVDGISTAVTDRGYGTILVTEHSPENFLQVLNPSGVLGVIGVGLVATSLLLEIRKLGLPFVLIDHEDESVPSDTVFVDNFDVSRQLTHFLLGQGHRHLQFVGDPCFAQSFRHRWLGFRTALEEHGIPLRQSNELVGSLGVTRDEHMACLTRVVSQLIRGGEMPTAFVCANDSLAISVVTMLRQFDVDVPADVSVTGFDDIDDASEMKPALTTVYVDKKQMGARAVDLLLQRIDHPDAPREKLHICGDIVLRDSTAAPPLRWDQTDREA
ncbi:LacI family transcriptional regulator [Alicyclobacillus sacchari]|uniref:LacI family transcriptional regulator n=2 Tax=Alicyclobacillus sacchari TaxID=392010 RepID=A0A4R8LSV7_9BACL|nr:LacI family transcriptional regulator [Alicyclobacillus sacchari]GMA58417.1 LacI family transcriptional regulator [Alicyclobacillus sacchari]